MTRNDQPGDPAQQDLLWTGYHPRAALPAFATAAVLTAVVLSGRWYLVGLSELAERAGAWAVFALAWAVWPALVIVFLYRTVFYSYRLTDRMLLADFGFLFYPVTPVPLTDVQTVTYGGAWPAKLLGVGWVEVGVGDAAIRMKGVRDPKGFAQKIRPARQGQTGPGEGGGKP
jgi:hypothetical protein